VFFHCKSKKAAEPQDGGEHHGGKA